MLHSGETIGEVKMFNNNLPGAKQVEDDLLSVCQEQQVDSLLIGTEATSFYDFHILTFLAESEKLSAFSPKMYRINPKLIKNFKKSYPDCDNTDLTAAFFLLLLHPIRKFL